MEGSVSFVLLESPPISFMLFFKLSLKHILNLQSERLCSFWLGKHLGLNFELYAYAMKKSVRPVCIARVWNGMVPTVGLGLKYNLVYNFWEMDLYTCFLICSLIEITSANWSHTLFSMLFT